MVYPDPEPLISKTKKRPHFFLRLGFYDPLIPCKAFATNSLKIGV